MCCVVFSVDWAMASGAIAVYKLWLSTGLRTSCSQGAHVRGYDATRTPGHTLVDTSAGDHCALVVEAHSAIGLSLHPFSPLRS